MSDPILDALNLVTLKEMWPRVAQDNFFKKSPREAYLRDHCLHPFGGGAFMQQTFLYKPLIGGAYGIGASFNMTKRETLSGTIFDMKYYEVAVPQYKEIVQVLNKGPLAGLSLIEIDLKNAMDTISAIIGIDLNNSGQGSRSLSINGWPEAVNDGITPGYDGNVYTAYGTQARNGAVGIALNSIPQFCGNPDGSQGPLTFDILDLAYEDATIGDVEPDLITMNKAMYHAAKATMQRQQRFNQERDPYWGASGFRLNGAMVLKDDYFPSLRYGVNDPDLGNYLTGTFVSPGTTANGGTAAALSNLPASGTVVTVGEVILMTNTRSEAFRISDDPEYGFGWSGFLPAQDNTRVVGYVKAAVNYENGSPRYFKSLYGLGL